jgi:hypothetical protein
LHIGRFLEERPAGVPQTRCVVDHQPRRFEIGRGARDLKLHALKIGDWLGELFPFLDVVDRCVERALGETDHLRADADPPLVQRLDGDLVSLADFTEYVPTRNVTVLEQQLARAARADSELVLFLAHREPLEAALDEKRRDAAIPGFGVDIGEHDEQAGLIPRW